MQPCLLGQSIITHLTSDGEDGTMSREKPPAVIYSYSLSIINESIRILDPRMIEGSDGHKDKW